MGQSESVNRRTENTMAKSKRTNNDIQNSTQKTRNNCIVDRNSVNTGRTLIKTATKSSIHIQY